MFEEVVGKTVKAQYKRANRESVDVVIEVTAKLTLPRRGARWHICSGAHGCREGGRHRVVPCRLLPPVVCRGRGRAPLQADRRLRRGRVVCHDRQHVLWLSRAGDRQGLGMGAGSGG
jgi:hypothetical protein